MLSTMRTRSTLIPLLRGVLKTMGRWPTGRRPGGMSGDRREPEPRRLRGLGMPTALRRDEHRLRGGSRWPGQHEIPGAGSEPSPGRAEPDLTTSPAPARVLNLTRG